MVIVLSLERLDSLLQPFTAKKLFLLRHSMIVMFITFITSAGIYIVLPVSSSVIQSPSANNRTEQAYIIAIRPGYTSTLLLDWFTIVSLTFSHNILPVLVLVLVLIISIIIFFSKYTAKLSTHLKSNKSKNYQRKITTIAVCIAGMYILLSVPDIFAQVLIVSDDDYKTTGRFKVFPFSSCILETLC